jgi:glutamine synthetase
MGGPLRTPKDVVEFIRKEGVEIVDLRFMDFPGLWQHFSVPAREIEQDTFAQGLGFDGSSIRGWQAINESDMLVKPVPESAFLDPFLAAKTLVMICNICDPVTGEDYTRDPPQHRPQGRQLREALGACGYGLLRPRSGIFHL